VASHHHTSGDTTFHGLRQEVDEATFGESGDKFIIFAAIERSMRRRVTPTMAGLVVLWAWQFYAAALPQEHQQERILGTTNPQPTPSGQTGTGMESLGAAAAKPGEAGDAEKPWLGRPRRPLYRLNRSDVVMVTFTVSPEFDQLLTVQPDGFITLKDAGAVYAQGLTLEELQATVQRAYTGYLHNPQASVVLKEFEHPYFVAGGELGRPGRYELRTDTNILQAVQIAGGFTHFSKHSQVLLFRNVNDEVVEAHLFDIKRMMKQKSLREIPRLQPGDLLFVPQNSISKIEPFLSRPSMGMYISSNQF